MDNTIQKQSRDSEMIEFDLKRLIPIIISKAWLIGLVMLLCGMIALGATMLFMTPQYKSTAMFYVNNSVSFGDTTLDITSGDISTSKSLVDSYIVILRTRGTLRDVIDYADLNRSYSELLSMISANSGFRRFEA